MKKFMTLSALLLAAVLVSGCYTTGLSLRESGNFNYSNFIYGLYGDKTSVSEKDKKIERPIRLAVAQVGESAPHKAVIEKLENEKYLVSKIVPLPAGGSEPNYYSNNDNKNNIEEFEKRMIKMRQLAKDLEADYIFLFGGSADIGATPNFFQFFDITLIGGFIVPSNKIEAEGRASGVLIDVETGKVLFLVSSDAKMSSYVPTYILQGEQDQVLVKVRNELVTKLVDEFVEKLKGYFRPEVAPVEKKNFLTQIKNRIFVNRNTS